MALSVLSSVGLVAASAAADEKERPAQRQQTEARSFRQDLRRLTLTGQGAEVRSAVIQRLGRDRSEVEAAALLEILAIADAWSGVGSPQPIDVGFAELPDDWEAGLDVARAEVVRGAYAVALIHLETLRASATSLAAAARAVELRELASGALRAHRAPVIVEQVETPAVTPAIIEQDDETPAVTKHQWYGWQTLLTDGASLFVAPFVPAGGLGGYLLGGPIVHLGHGRPGIAAASLGVRVGAPLLGGLTGAAIAKGECGSCELTGTVFGIIGLGLGMAGAVAIDAAVLGREDVRVEPKKSAALSPTAGPRREGGFDVGLVGTW